MNWNLIGTRADMHQCVQLQRIAAKRAVQDDVSNSDFNGLVSSWDRLQERKRVLKMRPKPAAMKVQAKERPNRARATVAGPAVAEPESLEAEAAKLSQITTNPVAKVVNP